MSEKKLPSHEVYYVKGEKTEDEKAEWLKLGAAWPHADGEGLDIVLRVLPAGGFNGRLKVRKIKPKGEQRHAGSGTTTPRLGHYVCRRSVIKATMEGG